MGVRMTWPWMLVILLVNLGADRYLAATAPDADTTSPASYPVLLVAELATMLAISSLAVNWHRYIFFDEIPLGFAARMRLDPPVWRYFGNMLLVIAILAILAVLAIALVALVAPMPATDAQPPAWAYALTVLLMLGAATFFYRLSVKLPAIAIGRNDYSFRQALADTRGNAGALLGFVLLQALAGSVLLLGMMTLGKAAGAIGGVGQLILLTPVLVAVNWFAILWNVTVLTSLYGYFAEGRNF